MSNFFKQINGVFTINIDGKEHPNLVVGTGLSSIFADTPVTSLCDTLKVFNDDTEVQMSDIDYLSPVATSSNVTDTKYGVTGDGITDYFYMRKTWTFYQGQITGVINKLAVYSDNGSLYAAALLKNEAGELDPVRPLFAPKVEITYESRWHFKQDDSYNIGTPVYFSQAGMVIVKTNMGDKNNSVTYENMNSPFRITSVEMFADEITTNDSLPTTSLGPIDAEDYTINFVDGEFNAYGQYLNIVLPKDKYISDTPIASIVITTTRGKWQVGFDAPLEKPTLSKREISLTIPFVHGVVLPDGEFEVTGNPDAINSIFSDLINSTYNISVREVSYDGAGTVQTSRTVVTPADPNAEPPTEESSEVVVEDVSAYFANMKDTSKEFSFIVPDNDTVTVFAGTSADVSDYLDGTVEGISLTFTPTEELTGSVDGEALTNTGITIAAGELISVTCGNGAINVFVASNGDSLTTSASVDITEVPDNLFVGVLNVTTGTQLTVY